MHDSITWVGMDVHKESIVVAAISGEGKTTTRWEIPNTDKGQARLVARLREMGDVRCVYEAGPCGYDLRRILDTKNIHCDVIAPSMIPVRPGDRVKTDRRDAEKLARMHRMGELSAIHVPTRSQEALRDLLRAREDACEDLVRRRHRLQKFLLRRELMSFVGLVPGEHSSGIKQRRGSITRTGNAHVRRALVEAAWHDRHSPRSTGETIRKRREGQPPGVIETARKAEKRLYRKFTRMVMRGKPTTGAATALARELAGFVWAIGHV